MLSDFEEFGIFKLTLYWVLWVLAAQRAPNRPRLRERGHKIQAHLLKYIGCLGESGYPQRSDIFLFLVVYPNRKNRPQQKTGDSQKGTACQPLGKLSKAASSCARWRSPERHTRRAPGAGLVSAQVDPVNIKDSRASLRMGIGDPCPLGLPPVSTTGYMERGFGTLVMKGTLFGQPQQAYPRSRRLSW